MVSSTKPASFSVSVWMATCTSCSSATASAVSIAAGVVPQSSCSLRPTAPASTCSRSGPGAEALPLPSRPRLTGNSSIASSIRWMFHTPGVHVVAAVPVAGPVPPPSSVVSPALIASVTICGQMKWMCVSSPPGVTIFPSPAMTSVPAPTTMPLVTPAMMSGLPALPMPTIRPSRMPMSAFTMPQWSTTIALVMTVSSTSSPRVARADCPMPSRITLPPPNFASSPGTVRSRSMRMSSSVSASRTRSPAVGP